jgi:hypothetical protein
VAINGQSQTNAGKSNEWYTPPAVFAALGARFDLDVASPGLDKCFVPADVAVTEGSLEKEWSGFVWMNAPFGARGELSIWLRKFIRHGNGVCLVPDRTSAPWWREHSSQADLIFFTYKRLRFIPGPGTKASSPVDGIALWACGEKGVAALKRAEAAGLGECWKRNRN